MEKHIHGGNIYKYSDCIDFSANCNPLGTPESVIRAGEEALRHSAAYPQVGYWPLRQAIAEYESRKIADLAREERTVKAAGADTEYMPGEKQNRSTACTERYQINADQVICGNGAAELIFTLCRARRPKRALVLAPTFAEYEQALASTGCEVEHYYLKKEDGFALTEDFLQALRPDLDLIFLCNPNNPTGLLIEKDFMKQILKKCQEQGIFLVVDECFQDFIKEPEAYTLKPELEQYENLFLLKAFTKRYAMAGIRLGYGLSAKRELLEQMEQCVQPWNISTIAQYCGMAALQEEAYVEESRRLIFSEKEFLKREMRRLGLAVYESEANYLFFHGSADLFEQCVQNKILIRDCGNYIGLEKGYYRIAVKQHEDNQKLIQALELLGA